MSDDEDDVDADLVELLRAHLQGKAGGGGGDEPETGVLEGTEYVYDHGVDVAIDMGCTKRAAEAIHAQMQQARYSAAAWSRHELHPRARDGDAAVAFVFTMDLLNFSFWSALADDERFAVDYPGRRWTGYWSLVAALRRALDDDIPITDPRFWQDEHQCSLDALRHVFRSCTDEEMPMLRERLACLREGGQVLCRMYDGSFTDVVSAVRLVNLLARDFPCFRDEHAFDGRRRPVRLLKRAQILVADLWACFQGESWGKFRDIDKITIFADYRVPQILISMGALYCCPSLSAAIREKRLIECGSAWEVQLRACSIWCVELIRREIFRRHPGTHVNAILIDFFLYDKMKELEEKGAVVIPHHRTRSIWY